MATGLPIGEYRWTQRWTFPEDLSLKPSRLPNGKPNNPLENIDRNGMLDTNLVPNPVSSSSTPIRRPEVGALYQTEYDRQYSQLPINPVDFTRSAPATRKRGVKAAPDDVTHHHLNPFWHVPEDRTGNIPFEKRNQRLWGRLNPGPTDLPLFSSNQREFKGADDVDIHVKDYNMTVKNKPYVENHFIALNTKHSMSPKVNPFSDRG